MTQTRHREGDPRHGALVRRLVCVAALPIIAALYGAACSDPAAPVVLLQLRGNVTIDGTPAPGVRILLQDRRAMIDPGHTLATATTDAAGNYQIRARADRPGYVPGCDFLVLFVEGFQFFTTASAPIGCVSDQQTINLSATTSP